MTSTAQAETPLPRVRGLIFYGFPLHAPGRPSHSRAEHLRRITLPMLFLQGTRDRLADLELMTAVCRELDSRARLEVVEGADHSFNLPRRLGLGLQEVADDLARRTRRWLEELSL